ncbi:MAG: efflux RND transporter permease subunit [Crocinitomicaceae bacterium]|nr:efflux RND transporter permease subunit [Crocinitomicaceae bacterium]
MNKFIKGIITFSLKNKMMIFALTILLCIAGVFSFINTPLEAFPDVTNTQIIIVTDWKGRSAEEVERFVSIPIEVAMNSVQKKTNVRSITMFGLSIIKVIFEDDVDDFFARQQVNNLIRNVKFPVGVEPNIQPPYGPTGEIFRYVLKSKNRTSTDLLTIQNWTIDRQLRAVPGVADIVAFGGQVKIYEIQPDPAQLAKYDINLFDLQEAVSKSNLNVGGDVLVENNQAFVVRGLGLINQVTDIENTIVKNIDGTPLLIKHIADVKITGSQRVGQVGKDSEDDVVEGIIVMRKGENPSHVLARVKEKIKELNENVLPSDVEMVTFYDRDNLMAYCTKTVSKNLLEGIIFVTVIVFLFMADWRTTIIVAIIIPLSLLFAFLLLYFKGMSANLLSLGAVDFGIIIDGAVVMVEGIFVVLDAQAKKLGMNRFNKVAKLGLIRKTGIEMGKAVFFSKLIIITALLPIFAFQKVEGKMFSPLAFTLGFALIGALLFTLTLVPVLSSILLKKNVREKHSFIVRFFNSIFSRGIEWSFANQLKITLISVSILLLSLFSTKWLGTEFLPTLNEGALWVEAKLPMSSSLEETTRQVKKLRSELNTFPEVNGVLSQTGRSNDGTDPSGFFYVQMQVNLKPKDEWRKGLSIDDLISEMDVKMKKFPGINFNYSQPIIDNVAEAVAGMNANNAVKVFGTDLKVMDSLSNLILSSIKNVDGVKDAGILRNIGQPEMQVHFDKQKMAVYGVTMKNAQDIIEIAIGGKNITEKYEGESRFNVRIRYPIQFRNSKEKMLRLMIPRENGNVIPLSEIAEIKQVTGPAFVYRDNNKRFIGVKFSVRERDLGSTINEAQKNVDNNIKLPKGYTIVWTGEFENQLRASNTLGNVVPFSLIGIFILLFILFGNMKDAGLVLLNVPFAIIGGIFALHLTGVNFGISAGVGFIALFGICVQNGVILISVFNKNLKSKIDIITAIKEGVKSRIRPVVMTALMAAIGLLPAALSTGIGSESQKPLAIVIIGGLITATILTLMTFPVIYYWSYRKKYKNQTLLKVKQDEN